jgi:hypothetical protein
MYSEPMRRAEEYARRRGLSIEGQIGGGTQGVVLRTNLGTAVKALLDASFYVCERDVYLRLRKLDIDKIRGFWVPRLINHHDELLVIEMQTVHPPYVLDFASAYLDHPPSYMEDSDDAQVREDWEKEKEDQFEDRWPEVRSLISAFRGYGIFLGDLNPRNIAFAD